MGTLQTRMGTLRDEDTRNRDGVSGSWYGTHRDGLGTPGTMKGTPEIRMGTLRVGDTGDGDTTNQGGDTREQGWGHHKPGWGH